MSISQEWISRRVTQRRVRPRPPVESRRARLRPAVGVRKVPASRSCPHDKLGSRPAPCPGPWMGASAIRNPCAARSGCVRPGSRSSTAARSSTRSSTSTTARSAAAAPGRRRGARAPVRGPAHGRLAKLCLGFASGWTGVGGGLGSMAPMKTIITFLVVLISSLALSGGVASAATREYEGTVVSVNRDARTFRLHDSSAARSASRSPARLASNASAASPACARARSASRPPSGAPTAAGSRPRSSAPAAAAVMATTTSGGDDNGSGGDGSDDKPSGHGPRDPDDGGRGDDLHAPVVVLQHAAAAAQQPPRPAARTAARSWRAPRPRARCRRRRWPRRPGPRRAGPWRGRARGGRSCRPGASRSGGDPRGRHAAERTRRRWISAPLRVAADRDVPRLAAPDGDVAAARDRVADARGERRGGQVGGHALGDAAGVQPHAGRPRDTALGVEGHASLAVPAGRARRPPRRGGGERRLDVRAADRVP